MTNPTDVIAWFCSNDTGMSSKCIAAALSGVKPEDIRHPGTPSDPADLGRCLRLLERFPEWKPRMAEMATVSKQWAAVIPYWDEVSQSMIDEVGIDWSKGKSAPKTYNLMKERGF